MDVPSYDVGTWRDRVGNKVKNCIQITARSKLGSGAETVCHLQDLSQSTCAVKAQPLSQACADTLAGNSALKSIPDNYEAAVSPGFLGMLFITPRIAPFFEVRTSCLKEAFRPAIPKYKPTTKFRRHKMSPAARILGSCQSCSKLAKLKQINKLIQSHTTLYSHGIWISPPWTLPSLCTQANRTVFRLFAKAQDVSSSKIHGPNQIFLVSSPTVQGRNRKQKGNQNTYQKGTQDRLLEMNKDNTRCSRLHWE